jgi:peroxiredoxin
VGLGPKVGEVLPRFSLEDQHGVSRDLASLTGPKGLVLVFFRSADW